MHVFVEEELTRVSCTGESESGSSSSSKDELEEDGTDLEEKWRRVMRKSFERMDGVALCTCACGSVGYKCGCHPMEVPLGGSTAVVVVLTPEYIVVANCGDSRAVLCRAGTPIPLSQDHKVRYLYPPSPTMVGDVKQVYSHSMAYTLILRWDKLYRL